MDNKKINRTRRQRGYAFENDIVKLYNGLSGWSAKRLGSPSIKLPDVMCINNLYKTIIAIEAKSTVQNYAYVPQDQIERCRDWVNMFSLYDTKQVILAFKFGRTAKVEKNILQTRKLRYYYKIFPHKEIPPSEVRADYDGNTMIKDKDGWRAIQLEELKI